MCLTIAIVMWISKKLKLKSDILEKTQKELLDNKIELETRNEFLQEQIRNQ